MLELKSYRKLKNEPYSEFVKVSKLKARDIEIMFNIYSNYYSNTDIEIFKKDLSEKTGVFVIREPKKDFLVGFSTVMERNFKVNGKTAYAFFSGDTIIEEAYWGSRALQRAMFRYVMSFKLKHTGSPIYWILISKGFKTYLLLANNYDHYYPNPENKDHYLKDYVDAYCQQFFDDYYDNQTNLIDFGDNYQSLKPDVAPITQDMRNKNRKIEYFEQCNPSWVQGTELPCIGKLSWMDIFQTAFRFVKKSSMKSSPKKSDVTSHSNDSLDQKDHDDHKVA